METQDTIRVYRLVASAFLTKEELTLKKLLGVTPSTYSNTFLKIDKQTGHFTYADNTATENPNVNDNFPVPQNEGDAKKAVETYLVKCLAATKLVNAAGFKFPFLFSNLEFLSAVSVTNNKTKKIEMWDVTYAAYVKPTLDEDKVQVLNGGAVFKIGYGSKLVGLNYYWLPIEKAVTTERYKTILRNEEGIAVDYQIIYMIEADKALCAPYILTNNIQQDFNSLKNISA